MCKGLKLGNSSDVADKMATANLCELLQKLAGVLLVFPMRVVQYKATAVNCKERERKLNGFPTFKLTAGFSSFG